MTFLRLWSVMLIVLGATSCKWLSDDLTGGSPGVSKVTSLGLEAENALSQRIKMSKDRLMSLFDEKRGQWKEAEWWQQANILETLAEYERQFPGDQPKFSWIADLVFSKNRGKSFINEYFDDIGWWGLAWVRAYEVTREERYLEMSKKLFDHIAREGWVESTCKGGIRWSTKDGVKNAISTEVFLRLALRLYFNTPERDATSRDQYRAWADKAWTWFRQSGLIVQETHQVTDKLDMATCKNGDPAAFTYNQGVILGALADLYTLHNQDPQYLDLAQKIALANWRYNSQDQVLVEYGGDQNVGRDGAIFKGIFMRHLTSLRRVLPEDLRKEHEPYVKATAAAVWKNQNPKGYFTESWAIPLGGDAMNARSHVAGLDALLAASLLVEGPSRTDL